MALSLNPPASNPYLARVCESCGAEADPETMKIVHTATTEPTDEQLVEWLSDGSECESTDGCIVELDGRCEHGHQSWVRRLGMI